MAPINGNFNASYSVLVNGTSLNLQVSVSPNYLPGVPQGTDMLDAGEVFIDVIGRLEDMLVTMLEEEKQP